MKENGCVWIRSAVPEHALKDLESVCGTGNKRLNITDVKGFVSNYVLDEISPALPNAIPVRAIFFDKSRSKNWSLNWHQDRVIAVAERHESSGYSNWTRKDQVWHCEPPLDILERMFFVQIYLDDVGENNGPTEFLLGSHKIGKVLNADISDKLANGETVKGVASRGDILLVKALVLHRSTKAIVIQPRRILRIDFANFDLPEPLNWAKY